MLLNLQKYLVLPNLCLNLKNPIQFFRFFINDFHDIKKVPEKQASKICLGLCIVNKHEGNIQEFFLSLKVDGNKKLGGSKRRRQLNFSLALWRSRVIFNLSVSFLCKQSISFSACYSFINR